MFFSGPRMVLPISREKISLPAIMVKGTSVPYKSLLGNPHEIMNTWESPKKH